MLQTVFTQNSCLFCSAALGYGCSCLIQGVLINIPSRMPVLRAASPPTAACALEASADQGGAKTWSWYIDAGGWRYPQCLSQSICASFPHWYHYSPPAGTLPLPVTWACSHFRRDTWFQDRALPGTTSALAAPCRSGVPERSGDATVYLMCATLQGTKPSVSPCTPPDVHSAHSSLLSCSAPGSAGTSELTSTQEWRK